LKPTSLLRPARFRFTEDADKAAFGDGWRTYDEAKIVRLPARELIKIEEELGTSVVDVIRGVRSESMLGYLAATWIVLHLEDPDLAGPYDAYSPVVLLAEWAPMPEQEAAVDMVGPFDQTPSTPSAEPSPSE
jgi:hypothetical protein